MCNNPPSGHVCAGAILLRAVESPWGCSEGQWAAKRVNSTCVCVCRDGAVLEGCAGMRENEQGSGCDPAWNKVWESVPHPSLPARVCVCLAENEFLMTPIVADAWPLLSKWHAYSYLIIRSLLRPLQDLLLTPRVIDGETEARRGKHRPLVFASWTGIGQLRGSGSNAHSPFFLPRQIQNPGCTPLARPVRPTPP